MSTSCRRVWSWAGDIGKKLRRWLRGCPEPADGRGQLTEAEVKAVMNQVMDFPWMGGKKGTANLVHDRVAWVGPESYDKIKLCMVQMAGEELAKRRKPRETPPFEMPKPSRINEVWSSDLAEIKAWGKHYDVGTFMDIHSQEHLVLEATTHAADAAFVRDLFEVACFRRGTPPTVCTKTDRGGQYRALAFAEALEGRTQHVKIPPGCPWFNGEVERGNRDLKAVLYGLIARTPRPEAGDELKTLGHLCDRARSVLNERVARPSLGNVTPHEVAGGLEELVRAGNREFVAQQREDRKKRLAERPRASWKEGLSSLLQVAERTTAELLRFLRLSRHDYTFLSK